MSGSKTEKPTSRQIQKAREKGDIPRSKDVVAVLSIALVGVVAFASLEGVAREMASVWMLAIRTIENPTEQWIPFAQTVSWVVVKHAILVMSMAIVVTMGVSLVQSGFLITTHPLIPDLSKLNPAEGVKRLFQMDKVFELVKLVVIATAVSFIVYLILRSRMADVARLPIGELAAIMATWKALLVQLLILILVVLIFIAVVDFLFQQAHWTSQHMMSREEVIQQFKESEGDPMMKSQRRQIGQRYALEEKTVDPIKRANLVVVNSQGRYIGMLWNEAQMKVPIVVDKGVDRSGSVLAMARTNKTPIRLDEEFVRLAYPRVETGRWIPTGVAGMAGAIYGAIKRTP